MIYDGRLLTDFSEPQVDASNGGVGIGGAGVIELIAPAKCT